MKVAELIELLSQFDDDDEVVIAVDSDHDIFSPLEDVTSGFYIAEDEYNGDFVDADDADEDENINLNSVPRAAALWPSEL